jgi:hypothetical protein
LSGARPVIPFLSIALAVSSLALTGAKILIYLIRASGLTTAASVRII